MKRPTTALRKFLESASPDEAREVAKEAGTSVSYLRHVAHGRRKLSADVAQALAHASRTLHKRSLRLDQRELCHACARCPLAR